MTAPDFLVVFDLDDTLYLERDFVMSGYRAVADWLGADPRLAGFDQTCRALFEAGQRSAIFDDALALHGLGDDPFLVRQLVDVYRGHAPSIALAPDARAYLTQRHETAPFALITDGPAHTQRAKITALGLDRIVDYIICTGALGSGFGKPHPLAFGMVEIWAEGRRRPLAYVADNCAKDFVTPKARGWFTVQIRRPGAVHDAGVPSAAFGRDHAAHAVIESFDDLDACLSEAGATTRGQAIPVKHFAGTYGQIAP